MKKLLPLFILLFAFAVNGQTTESYTTAIISKLDKASMEILKKRKQEVEKKIDQLIKTVPLDYGKRRGAEIELEVINMQISALSSKTLQKDLIVELSDNQNQTELMRIIVLQNQRIIELLEVLTKKK
jgi:ABC-type enterochelin transport system ATPase subunit